MLLLVLLVGCKRPPEAPKDLDALATYLFVEHLAEDPEVMAVGLQNLRTWFETDYDPDEKSGYELLEGLPGDSVSSLNGSTAYEDPKAKASRKVPSGGAGAATDGAHPFDDYVAALTAVDQDVVFPKQFDDWSRTWRLCDGETFADQGCDLLEADEEQDNNFGFGFKSEGESYNQYRWVELDDGSWAMSHRNWQLYPPEVSNSLMEVDDQYYLNTFVPSSDGKTVYRFQATWAYFGDDVPKGSALDLTTGSMLSSSADLEEWLDENDP